MAEAVVDPLETVEVHHQQAEAALVAPAALDLVVHGVEEECPVVQVRQGVDRREPDGRVASSSLDARDDHPGVGEQQERREVDRDPRKCVLVALRWDRSGYGRDAVYHGRLGREDERDPGRGNERGAADQDGVEEEERARRSAGQKDQHRQEDDGGAAFHYYAARSEVARRQQFVDHQHEDPGEDQRGEDLRFHRLPDLADRDDKQHDEDERPGDNPDRTVECVDGEGATQDFVHFVFGLPEASSRQGIGACAGDALTGLQAHAGLERNGGQRHALGTLGRIAAGRIPGLALAFDEAAVERTVAEQSSRKQNGHDHQKNRGRP